MSRWLLAAVLVLCWLPATAAEQAGAGMRPLRVQDMGELNGGGIWVDVRMNEIRVSPVRAHVGDVVRIDLAIENRGEGRETVSLDVLANGKWVAGKLFTYGDTGYRKYRESLHWDTRGAKPGEYRIRAELVLPYASSPFDTLIDLGEPVVLMPAGTTFPGAEKAGGTAITRDPRYRPSGAAREGY